MLPFFFGKNYLRISKVEKKRKFEQFQVTKIKSVTVC